MSEIRELYQQLIIDHGRNPRNFRKITHSSCIIKEGYNPLCGDQLTLYLLCEDNKVVDVSFTGQGCAISMASASLMSEKVKGLSIDDAMRVFNQFSAMVKADNNEENHEASLGKLSVLQGVREYPSRIKCATLAWHTLKSSLLGELGGIKTE